MASDGIRWAVLAAQAVVSAGGMAVCASQLARGAEAAVYLPVLVGIVAYWMPSPLLSLPGQHQQHQQPGQGDDSRSVAGSVRLLGSDETSAATTADWVSFQQAENKM